MTTPPFGSSAKAAAAGPAPVQAPAPAHRLVINADTGALHLGAGAGAGADTAAPRVWPPMPAPAASYSYRNEAGRAHEAAVDAYAQRVLAARGAQLWTLARRRLEERGRGVLFFPLEAADVAAGARVRLAHDYMARDELAGANSTGALAKTLALVDLYEPASEMLLLLAVRISAAHAVTYSCMRVRGRGRERDDAAGTMSTAAAAAPSCGAAACTSPAGAGKRCSSCRSVWYCSAACQRADWAARHSAECADVVR